MRYVDQETRDRTAERIRREMQALDAQVARDCTVRAKRRSYHAHMALLLLITLPLLSMVMAWQMQGH